MMKSTGFRIQERREALGWSREDLAQKLETTRMTVWRVENGETKIAADDLPRWARVLQTSPAELLP